MAKHQLKPFTIYCGDNLKMLNEIPDESVDLVYIDPPFNNYIPLILRKRKKPEQTCLDIDSDIYYPIQVKQKDKAGRPDID